MELKFCGGGGQKTHEEEEERKFGEERESLMCFYTFPKVQVNLALVGFSLVDL